VVSESKSIPSPQRLNTDATISNLISRFICNLLSPRTMLLHSEATEQINSKTECFASKEVQYELNDYCADPLVSHAGFTEEIC
jgi:hypothetical protein